MTTIELIIVSSLFCFGWNYATLYDEQGKEIAWRFRWFVLEYLPEITHKPLVGCIVCMASVYSTLVYWANFYFSGQHICVKTFLIWIVVVVSTAGLNRILKNL